jgi:hypothetical protein
MTISPRRKRIGVVFGLLILAGFGWVVWPFIAGSGHMQSFCSSLAVGTSVARSFTNRARSGGSPATYSLSLTGWCHRSIPLMTRERVIRLGNLWNF